MVRLPLGYNVRCAVTACCWILVNSTTNGPLHDGTGARLHVIGISLLPFLSVSCYSELTMAIVTNLLPTFPMSMPYSWRYHYTDRGGSPDGDTSIELLLEKSRGVQTMDSPRLYPVRITHGRKAEGMHAAPSECLRETTHRSIAGNPLSIGTVWERHRSCTPSL